MARTKTLIFKASFGCESPADRGLGGGAARIRNAGDGRPRFCQHLCARMLPQRLLAFGNPQVRHQNPRRDRTR